MKQDYIVEDILNVITLDKDAGNLIFLDKRFVTMEDAHRIHLKLVESGLSVPIILLVAGNPNEIVKTVDLEKKG